MRVWLRACLPRVIAEPGSSLVVGAPLSPPAAAPAWRRGTHCSVSQMQHSLGTWAAAVHALPACPSWGRGRGRTAEQGLPGARWDEELSRCRAQRAPPQRRRLQWGAERRPSGAPAAAGARSARQQGCHRRRWRSAQACEARAECRGARLPTTWTRSPPRCRSGPRPSPWPTRPTGRWRGVTGPWAACCRRRAAARRRPPAAPALNPPPLGAGSREAHRGRAGPRR